MTVQVATLSSTATFDYIRRFGKQLIDEESRCVVYNFDFLAAGRY